MIREDFFNKVFNKLRVISLHKIEKSHRYWNCVCECGKKTITRSDSLTSGNTRSCGCLKKYNSVVKTHGMSASFVYRTWASMLQRCNNKNNPRYKDWGGRGIKVCKRWISFENFYEDMGDKPCGLTLDRINNEGNYEPENCHWATTKEQGFNRRSNICYNEKYI